VYARLVNGNLLYVTSMIGSAIIIGKVSKTQVRRVSCGLIPDQIQKVNTIISNINGYFFNGKGYLLRVALCLTCECFVRGGILLSLRKRKSAIFLLFS
jgi:hypothetical protein